MLSTSKDHEIFRALDLQQTTAETQNSFVHKAQLQK